jgi:hypothetical protein
MLTPERQSYKTKQEFISLFPYVMYGRRIIYDSDYNIIELNSTYPNPFSAMKLDEVEVDNEDGFAYFDLTYNNGWESSSGTYYFKKVNSEWKFDGFSNLVYAGCFNDEDCYEKSDKLQADCEMTCEDKKGFPLKTEDQFSCVSDVCNCYCWDENTGRGSKIAPEWKNLH